ncbi:MAG: 16S rRNA (guanine(527)-N(7))-methyltransferase RsmG [Alphaproteobacteria bacterium]|jgi:16S rRNA (guanine527-N7)-methyltransferase|nr:16S rRNA (guanine(527)-N(7))-methyltransferase RsmG [Alphaproteobacteria bacterium]QQS57562.1 MAG: 16S rRNA (guanine(527)-N(7))-methyltransferase RsmG [Alphaproteobacteria bacterium]
MRPEAFTPEDLRRELSLSSSVMERLCIYHSLLVKWQKSINLVSDSTLPEAWHRHFYDSAQILQYLPKDRRVVADLGSGAGFPGMVLAILNPDLDMNLIESDERKCLFLRTVSRETDTDVSIHHGRIERVRESFVPEIVTARAFADISAILELSSVWNRKNKTLQLILLKGENADDEIENARTRFSLSVESFPSLTHPKARILRISHLSCE